MLKRFQKAGVEIRGCKKTQKIFSGCTEVKENDYSTEYLDLILNVKVVKDMEEAMEHIAHYGSAHSDTIVTMHHDRAMRFLREVDSSAVYVNASTRFTDGAQLGLGAEVAISTQRLHVRGPNGLRELTTYKWVIQGNYDIRI